MSEPTSPELIVGRVKLRLDPNRGGVLAGLWLDQDGDGVFAREDLILDTGPRQGLVLEVVETAEGAATSPSAAWMAGRTPGPRESWYPGHPARLSPVLDTLEQVAPNRLVVTGRLLWAGSWPYQLEWEVTEAGAVTLRMQLLEPTEVRPSEVLALGMDLRFHYHSPEAFRFRTARAAVDAEVWDLPAEVVRNWRGLEGYLRQRKEYGFAREEEIPWPDYNLVTLVQQGEADGHLWKAIAADTGPLTHWRGAHARGWMDVRDGEWGLGYGIPGMARRAPGSLSVDLDTGDLSAALQVRWWPRQARRACHRTTDREKLLAAHELFLLPRSGAWSEDLLPELDRRGLASAVLPPVAPDPESVRFPGPAETPAPAARGEGARFRIDEPAGVDRQAWPVSVGVPFAQGEVAVETPLALTTAEGAVLPHQAESLAFWPDGSVKWLLVDAQVDLPAGTGAVFSLAPTQEAPPVPPHAVRTFETQAGVRVETGALTFEVDREGTGFVDRVWLDLDGEEELVVGPGGGRRSVLDFVRSDCYGAGDHDVRGTLDESEVRIEELRVEVAGPLRAVVLLRGVYCNRRESEFTLRLEAYAGKPWIRAQHTFTYALDPQGEFLHAAGLRLPLRFSRRPTVTVSGCSALPTDASQVGLLQESLHRAVAWSQDRGSGVLQETEADARSAGWAMLTTERWGVTVAVQDFWQEFAKGIEVNRARGEVTAWFWPPQAPSLDLRRYSPWMYPQVGETLEPNPYQGEARNVGFATGLAKTSTAVFAFQAGRAVPSRAEALAQSFQHRPVAICSPEHYAAAELMGRFAGYDPAYPELERTLTDFCDWFIFNRQRFSWYGLVDYGDIGHVSQPPIRGEDGVYRLRDGWCYDIGRWGWTNTEGQEALGYFLTFLHTGHRPYFEAGAIAARHNQDVDIFHCGPRRYFGHTRHNVNHWGDGDFEIRISQPTPNRFYYYLTGDLRSRDVMAAVVDDLYLKERVTQCADLGAVLYGFMVRWEMTGDPVWRDRALGLCHAYGECQAADGNLPHSGFVIEAATGRRLNETIPPADERGLMFLHGFGATHAMVELEQLTGDARLGEMLHRHAVFCAGLKPTVCAYFHVLAHALDKTGEARFAEVLAANLVTRRILSGVYPRDRRHWTGVWPPEEAPEVECVKTAITGFDWSPLPVVLHALKTRGIAEKDVPS